MSAPVFTLQQVGLRLGAVQALQDLTLHIHAGERVALVGSNGCGKSSLLRLLHGLLPLSAGQFSHAPTLRQAMLFQRPHMLRCSAQNHVALGLWLAGMPWALARAQALAALHRVGLAPQAARSAKALSGGQQQRLALARAWALQPDVWLLDEPSASLDPHAKHAVEALMADFTAAPGPHGAAPTLIFSSHNLGQVKRLASRVLYLEQGRLLADLPVAVFFDGPSLHAVSPAAYLFVKGELG